MGGHWEGGVITPANVKGKIRQPADAGLVRRVRGAAGERGSGEGTPAEALRRGGWIGWGAVGRSEK